MNKLIIEIEHLKRSLSDVSSRISKDSIKRAIRLKEIELNELKGGYNV